MKQLLLVRHAKSSWSDPGLRDIERPLNKRGLRDAPKMAGHLHSLKIIPDTLITSPALRTRMTAGYFAETFDIETAQVDIRQDLYFGSEFDWLHIINTLDETIRCPAFFSHNPTITHFTNQFARNYIDNVPTCGVIHLQSEADTWEALHFDNTRMLNYYFPKLI
ncbi:MAG: histidine phosphatase family protein [Saprospiraceae bacterium]|nr:histidine phosphatase family protein [Bacteroidia bacterium]MBT8229625.1 histidine phosphatase family protein [Bacteroidia bacterium]NNF23108.1 histidine phosphatase family protein [Saprospiraceae bacterium]NNK89926.1 histidine phosphatase family protein [Saprospiraceae bacterium]